MKYKESQLDQSLRKWFQEDYSHRHLRQIRIEVGNLRGVNKLDISFNYPITAISGKNGAGKSTILALACCAYHNKRTGYKPQKRNKTYYTFSDFFIQHKTEVPPQGIVIRYDFALDYLKKTESNPKGIGIAYQKRRKAFGGKWNDYAERINRDTVFIGIDRIVPHSERSQSKSYSRSFTSTNVYGWEHKVVAAVSFVLEKKYDEYRHLTFRKYNLPVVMTGGLTYSGFNMGAGESALFEIFSTIYAISGSALVVIDEIEIGLHVAAQKRFIETLKRVCLETKTQVVCTTHSKEVLSCLPPDATYHIETISGNSILHNGISPEYAFSKLGSSEKELDIYIEDDVAEAILSSLLPTDTRTRIRFRIVGSASLISRQLGAAYINKHKAFAVFDGDQRTKNQANLKVFKNYLEKQYEDSDSYFEKNSDYLPSNTWPEKWLLDQANYHIDEIAKSVCCESYVFAHHLSIAINAEKHDELWTLANAIGKRKDEILTILTSCICPKITSENKSIINKINNLLSS